MKYSFFIWALLELSCFASDTLGSMKTQANTSLYREKKALENSQNCINAAITAEDFRHCNYDPKKFLIQREEAPDTGTTTEKPRQH